MTDSEIRYPNAKLSDAARNFARRNLKTTDDAISFLLNARAFAKSPTRSSALKVFNNDKVLVEMIFEGHKGDKPLPKASGRLRKFWASVKEAWAEFWDGFSETCC